MRERRQEEVERAEALRAGSGACDLADEQLPVGSYRRERRIVEDIQVLQVDDVGLEPANLLEHEGVPGEIDAVLSRPGRLQGCGVDDHLMRGDA